MRTTPPLEKCESAKVTTSTCDHRDDQFSCVSKTTCDTSESTPGKHSRTASPVNSDMEIEWRFAEARPSDLNEWAVELNQIEEYLDKKSLSASTTQASFKSSGKEPFGLAVVRPRTNETSQKLSPRNVSNDEHDHRLVSVDKYFSSVSCDKIRAYDSTSLFVFFPPPSSFFLPKGRPSFTSKSGASVRTSCEEAFDAIVKCGREWSPSHNRMFQFPKLDNRICSDLEKFQTRAESPSPSEVSRGGPQNILLHVDVAPLMGLSMPLLTSPVSVSNSPSHSATNFRGNLRID